MRKFVLSITLFLIALLAIDRTYGLGCDWLNNHAKRGETFFRNYLVSETEDDVLMFGSSRMVHHYVSRILEDSLGLSVWNAGVDGMGIIMNLGYLELVLKHHKPKLIIYDLSPYDLSQEENVKQLKNLRPYVTDDAIRRIVKSVDKKELFKLNSKLFRYNSSFIPLLRDYMRPGGKGENNGYAPLSGVMDKAPGAEENNAIQIDSLKIGFLDSFVQKCRKEGIKLIFVISPEFRSEKAFYSSYVEQVALRNQITFWDYSYFPGISDKISYFQDKEHLNNAGAECFTNILAEQLKRIRL